MNPEKHSKQIKAAAKRSGFAYCGLSRAEKLTQEAFELEEWLSKGLQGKMKYMENHFDKRVDPSLLVPGAKSVISLMYNYYPEKDLTSENQPKIAKYAYGEDYHYVIKDILRKMIGELTEEIGQFSARIFVDSAPVLEKAWAKRSGIGWQGKNTNLIHPKSGSFFFLAEIISDLEIIPDGPIKDYCGTCTACIDACPTDALYQPYKIDASRCISYLTIELKDDIIPSEFKGNMEGWVFGCDICQDVCPWNRFSSRHQENRFNVNPALFSWDVSDWMDMTEEVFKEIFSDSPIMRTKRKGMQRNISLFEKN